MSPSAETTRAIVQGHTIRLPPTSAQPGNKERSLFVSQRHLMDGNVKTREARARPRERTGKAAAFLCKVVFLEAPRGIYNHFVALKEKVTE